jgi:predicted MFS family arabinose efflux permease
MIIGSIIPTAGRVAGNVIQRSFTQNYCPNYLRGRLTATQAVFNYGTMPLGGLLGGALAISIGVRATLWISAAALIAVGTILMFSPVGYHRDLPTREPVH